MDFIVFLDIFEIFAEDCFLLRSFRKLLPSGFLPLSRFQLLAKGYTNFTRNSLKRPSPKSGESKVLVFSRVWPFNMHAPYILSADDLDDFSWIYRKPSILAADDFLGACYSYRKAMTPKKLWTLLFLDKDWMRPKSPQNEGNHAICHTIHPIFQLLHPYSNFFELIRIRHYITVALQ